MPAESVTEGAARRGWRESLEVYRHPRVIGMLFLGFSAGLPFLLIFSTLSLWLRDAEVSRTTVGFFSWVGITFSIKVLWAPVIDRLPLPLLTALLGKRRSWMLLAQAGIIAGLIGIALSDPGQQLVQVAMLALLIAFSSATQDVAIDAYRIEAVPQDLQGAMAATYQLGYRLALLVAGAGALYLAEFLSWQLSYFAMAGCMAVGVVTVLAIREPEVERDSATIARERQLESAVAAGARLSGGLRAAAAWFASAVVAPFLDFFARNGRMALLILLFISVYRLSDITMGVMANPFYDDLGFTKVDIANITKLYGFFMSIAGALLGGVLVAHFGILRPLLLGAVLVATTNLLFAYLATQGADLALLAVTISADNLSAGIAGTVFIAYLSSLVNQSYTATQYALFSSLFTLGGKFVAGFSGVVVDAAGYITFFIYASLLGIPAILLVLYLMHRERRGPAAAEQPAP